MGYACFRHLISSPTERLDQAGTFARRLDREQEALWLFLDLPGRPTFPLLVEAVKCRFKGETPDLR